MKNKIGIIIGREFKERVAKKTFIITTILMPLIMLALMVAPALIISFNTPTTRILAVIDESGQVFNELVKDQPENLILVSTDEPVDSAKISDKYDGTLLIPADVMEKPAASLFMRETASMVTENQITERLNSIIKEHRLRSYDIENLQQILEEVEPNLTLNTVRITETGEDESTSSGMAYAIGLVSTFILYMFLLMYGQMVMTSIIEEKSNRVLELVVSSVKPTQLMLGKIIGVGLVAVVQIAIWAILMCAMSLFVLPMLLPDSISAQVSLMNSGALDPSQATVDADLLQAISFFGSVSSILAVFGYLMLFMIGGFLFYASIFAAIGSSVDNIQDASQLVSFATIPIIVSLIFGVTVVQDPLSPLAFWLSVIPFTSPMVMMCRIPFGIPGWEIILSIVVLYLSFIVMAWIAGKIYRVGIFMYGKKPTIKELARWTRYK